MKINILATGIELTPAISQRVNKKISSLEKYLGESRANVVAHVEVGKITKHHKRGEVFRAEVHLTGAGFDVYATSTEEDLYFAIDRVRDEVVKELRRGKGKQSSLAKKGAELMKGAMKGFSWSLERLKGLRRRKK